jgi:hypothetical protein
MVTITGAVERTKSDGSKFYALILQGSPEMVKSENSGKFYLTARRTSIPSTLDENSAKMAIGTKLPGEIVKVQCEEPYEYTTSNNETIMLSFTYEYRDNESHVEEKLFA